MLNDDFGAKLALVFKALTLSNGRFAAGLFLMMRSMTSMARVSSGKKPVTRLSAVA